MVDIKVFSLDQAGDYNRLVKLKQDVVLAEEDENLFFIIAQENLAYLG